ncbi:MAG: hypothetical protein MI861_26975, partial [Pirellulales bacterium]|nr:hypothetical protein [Pirellulales bacterium]
MSTLPEDTTAESVIRAIVFIETTLTTMEPAAAKAPVEPAPLSAIAMMLPRESALTLTSSLRVTVDS